MVCATGQHVEVGSEVNPKSPDYLGLTPLLPFGFGFYLRSRLINMTAALKKRGHRAVHASNAEDAIQMAEINRPAMILTDLDLPTFDKLLSLLRAHRTLGNLKVAIIDINHPTIKDESVHVLEDFQSLDDLMDASEEAQTQS